MDAEPNKRSIEQAPDVGRKGCATIFSVRRAFAAFLLGISLLRATAAFGEPANDLIGVLERYETVEQDTLLDIARRFDLGFVELMAANPGIDPWVPGHGTTLLLPTAHLLPDGPRKGITINLADQRLYYFARHFEGVISFPVGVGRAGCETPLGQTKVVGKRKDPFWTPPASIREELPDLPTTVPPGPSNPLGQHALDLGWRGYVIHGTNKPLGVGRRVSHGCIRLYPEDAADLFELVPIGTPVRVVDQPVKLGWSAGELYMEVHPTQWQSDEVEAVGEVVVPDPAPESLWRILRAAGEAKHRLEWDLIRRITMERRGIPVRVTR